ncbi:hypothetical protein DFP74_4415 [Nocardiopsis sp. Huas11]|uniref:hypothetical protein n=1 Tax=Nocardiopsis sp. Huas11 TaxID=2183912 RepID=UPI000EB04043|nr:hypothetical protein [Nocardiopsis sp. Huas11]RKS08696.1 hypothetical protein DFP74_4415 [Nocardiopsis sp. Huas11]
MFAAILAALTLPAIAVIGTAVALQMPEPPERSYTPAADPIQGTDLIDAARRRLEDASSYRVRSLAHEGDGSGPYQGRPTDDNRRLLSITSQWFTHTSDPVPAVLLEWSGEGAAPTRMWAEGTSVLSWGGGSHQWFHEDPDDPTDDEAFFPVQTALAAIAENGHIVEEERAPFTPDPSLARGEEPTDTGPRPGVRLAGTFENADGATEFVVFTTVKGTPLGLSIETLPSATEALPPEWAWFSYREYEIVDLDVPVDLAVPAPDEIGPWDEASGP